MTPRAVIVAERLEHSYDEALSVGCTVGRSHTHSKSKANGVLPEMQKDHADEEPKGQLTTHPEQVDLLARRSPSRRLVSRTCSGCAALAALLLLAAPALGAEYWQMRRPDATIIVEGDRAFAERALARIVLLQETARLLFQWPSDFHPRRVLAFAVDETLLREVFAVDPIDMNAGALATQGLALVVAPLRPFNRRELEAMQYVYGRILSLEGATATWPECAKLGFGMMFTQAEYTGKSHLYIGASRILPWNPLTPERFVGDEPPSRSQLDADRRGFSCYLLDEMLVTGDSATRAAIGELYQALAAGTPIQSAIPPALGGTLQEFSRRFRTYYDLRNNRLHELDIKADLPLPEPAVSDAEAMPREKVRALLGQVCAKLANCRGREPTH